uniref:Uncharacterized protein n=1 Tax=Anopheles epiroticus TaxID=199890 RepID=A0A3F2YWJ1_9DIPT
MTSRSVSLLVALFFLLHCPAYSFGFGWWFLWSLTTAGLSTTTSATSSSVSPSSAVSQSANGLDISLGNRENSNTVGSDNGTNISNVEVNYARELPFTYPAVLSNLLPSSELRTILSADTLSPNVWIETILEAYYRAANESRRDTLGTLSTQLAELEAYAEDVASMLDRIRIAYGIELNRRLLALDVAVLRCTQGQAVDALAKSVLEGERDCVPDRLERARHAQREAAHNMSRLLVEWDEGYLRDEIARCPVQEADDFPPSNEYQLACISSILHEVHRNTLLMAHKARQLTLAATSELDTSKPNMLLCAERLVERAKESLDAIATVTSDCQTSVLQDGKV